MLKHVEGRREGERERERERQGWKEKGGGGKEGERGESNHEVNAVKR